MAKRQYFTPKLFKFLRDLANNNDREWFKKNKPRYQEHVQQPLIEFIGDFAGPLKKISPHFISDPKPVGGSLFRIYRDTRFSKDKSPYKTHAAAHFRHERAKDVHAPGFYVHLAPKEIFFGAGLWRPDSGSISKIRDAIVDDPKALQKVLKAKAFKTHLSMGGESLKRPPRGYDAEHPMIEHLKRKDWIVHKNFTQKTACSPEFIGEFVKACKAAAPLVRFLTEAVELDY